MGCVFLGGDEEMFGAATNAPLPPQFAFPLHLLPPLASSLSASLIRRRRRRSNIRMGHISWGASMSPKLEGEEEEWGTCNRRRKSNTEEEGKVGK